MGSIRRVAIAVALAGVVAAGCSGSTTPAPSRSSVVPPTSASAPPTASPGPAVTVEGILEHLEALDAIARRSDGNRAVGTFGYLRSLDYVREVLEDAGYEVSTPTFTMPVFEQTGPSTLAVAGADAGPGEAWIDGEDFRAALYSPAGTVRAAVAVVGDVTGAPSQPSGNGCSPGDFEGFPPGAVAVMARGGCFGRDLVLNAQRAGAVAAILVSTTTLPGRPVRPTLLYPDGLDVPVLAVSPEVGAALASGDAPTVALTVRTESRPEEVANVIAEMPGAPDAPVVMLGAHLDSVLDGPGINDNGSGAATILELAGWLAGRELRAPVRFAFWAGEEEGLYGSQAYVEELSSVERDAIRVYLNADMLASPNFIRFAGLTGVHDAELEAMLEAAFEAQGLAREPLEEAATDDYPFIQAGIPAITFYSGSLEVKTAGQAEDHGGTAGEAADGCYHQPCDTLDNVSEESLDGFARVLMDLVTALARPSA